MSRLHGLSLELSEREVPLALSGSFREHREPVSPRNSSFGSAPPLFWEHCSFAGAFADGNADSGGRYLHVNCHRGDAAEIRRLDKHWRSKGVNNHGYREAFPDTSPCAICDEWGWRMTTHRLFPNRRPGHRLWVQESFNPSRKAGEKPRYGADDKEKARIYFHASSMPKRMSRITLEIASVGVEQTGDSWGWVFGLRAVE